MRYWLCWILFAGTVGFLESGCKPQYSYTQPVARLDSLQTVWNKEWDEELNGLTDSLGEWKSSIINALQIIETAYQGKVKKSRAVELSQSHLVADQCGIMENDLQLLRTAREQERHRLSTLRKALEDRATRDAEGVEINPNYVLQALVTEDKLHMQLIDQLKNLHMRKASAGENFHALHPLLVQICDSLQKF